MKFSAVLAVAAFALDAAVMSAAPRIQVDNPSYEASIQAAGAVVQHVFTATNTGDQTLTITGAKPSCQCTTATPATAELAPGKSVGFLVSVDTAGFAGTVVRTVTLESNDPANRSLVLVVSVTNTGEALARLPSISVSDFQKRFYVLVDVRTPEEFASGHLLGAINIPLSELQNNTAAWTARLPKDVPVILQCKAGARSAQAAQILLKAGFANVLNLDGGVSEWAATFGSGYLFGF